MFDFSAEVRINVDDSYTGDLYHKGHSIRENERAQTDCKTFTLAPSGERDICFGNWSNIQDLTIFSNTTSELTITMGATALSPIPFAEHFSIQSSCINDAKIKNTSSVTGTYKVFVAGE